MSLAAVDTSLVAVQVSGAKSRLAAASDRRKIVAVGTGVCVYIGTSTSTTSIDHFENSMNILYNANQLNTPSTP